MREVLIKVYEYEELSEKAREKARENYGSFDSGDADVLNDCFIEELKEFGYKDVDISWRLGYCQGDGVIFTWRGEGEELLALCSRVFGGNIPRNIKHVLPLIEVVYQRRDSRYCNVFAVEVVTDFKFDECRDLSGRFIDAVTDLRKVLNDDRHTMCRKLEKMGYAHIEEVESEESFKERCKYNDYEFYEDGTMY